MTTYGLDYGGYLDPVQIATAGTPAPPTFVMRYSREISANEVSILHAAGLSVGMIFEYGADLGPNGRPAPLDGYNGGVRDAQLGLQHLTNLAAPDVVALYYTVDFAPKHSQLKTVNQYFKGIASAFPFARIGGYADYRTIGYLLNNRLVNYGWQTVDRSGTSFDQRCALYQNSLYHTIANVSTDYDEAFVDQWGQWGP